MFNSTQERWVIRSTNNTTCVNVLYLQYHHRTEERTGQPAKTARSTTYIEAPSFVCGTHYLYCKYILNFTPSKSFAVERGTQCPPFLLHRKNCCFLVVVGKNEEQKDKWDICGGIARALLPLQGRTVAQANPLLLGISLTSVLVELTKYSTRKDL